MVGRNQWVSAPHSRSPRLITSPPYAPVPGCWLRPRPLAGHTCSARALSARSEVKFSIGEPPSGKIRENPLLLGALEIS